ncbi:MAG: sulfatase, partial [Kofleriaceae bacterium]|nr:sulfatase [Kofleriaceae bacterium]
ALAASAPSPDKIRAKNVVVLLIDTQRADSFSVVGKDGGVGAKGYESLVPVSATFRNAYNNENWTKPSIASFDTGLYPTTHLARWRKDRCSKDLVFLSEHLQEKGFATAGLVSNISAGAKFGFDQGWDTFEKTDNAKLTFARALEWLDGRNKDKRFFLYVQTIDPHVPFSVPQGSAEAIYGGSYKGKLGPTFEQSEEDALNEKKMRLSPDDARWLRALYDAEVLYHDTYLQEFIAGLKKRSLLQDTLFVILNDHGEEFGEEGRWGHAWTMGDALFRSPLLMHFPGLFPAKIFEEVVEHIDVAPTIVDALGIAAMPDAQGQSLLALMRGQNSPERYPYSALLFGRPKRRALRIGDYKIRVQKGGAVELYDRRADPSEKQNLADSHTIARQLCESAMGEAIANPKRSERLSDISTPLSIRGESIP